MSATVDAVSPIPSPSEISHKSQDSGFSDSDRGPSPDREHEDHCQVVNRAVSTLSLTDREKAETSSSVADLTTLPPPPHSSTPKSKDLRKWPCNESPIVRKWTCPVNLWLNELRYRHEPECTSTLQNKAITAGISENVTRITTNAVNTIKNLYRQLTAICSKLTGLYRKINKGTISGCDKLFERLLVRMERILLEFNGRNDENFDCSGVAVAFKALSQHKNDISNLKSILKTVALLFSKNVEHIFLKYLKMLIDLLQEEHTPSSLVVILSGIGSLDLQAPHLGDLLACCCGITSLLSTLVDCSSPAVHTAALNILATVCCTPKSIQQFENSGGLEIVSDILSCKRVGEAEHCAAVSLFVQVTAPWVSQTVQGVNKYINTLVPSITDHINDCPSTEMLLLCGAALANISWIEVKSISPLVYYNSAGALLRAVRVQGPKASIFLKEQAATLLANMSAVNSVLPHLRQNRAVPALLCFLQVSVSPLQSVEEKAAAFRVQHKAVIGLSRLCSDPEAAKQVVELQGVSRLVRLCKDENERNNNDGVLVASLVALRKVASYCSADQMNSLNASELVEPKLLESFLLCSSDYLKQSLT